MTASDDFAAMSGFFAAHEAAVRLIAFAGMLTLMLGWERLAPRRADAGAAAEAGARPRRWAANLGLVVIDTGLLRFGFPLLAAGAALLAADRGWGVLNVVDAPGWLAFAVSVVLLDLAIWAQHVAMHKVPALWRLHRVHHSDLAFDATTALRFHPFEIALSMLLKIAVVIAIGAPAAAVIVSEVLLSGGALFNHGNVRLPAAVDRIVRTVVVTPDMHRVHHSIRRRETDSNYGFFFSFWDRLFRTYRAQPEGGHAGMTIGLPEFREAAAQGLGRLLLQPFSRERRAIPGTPRSAADSSRRR